MKKTITILLVVLLLTALLPFAAMAEDTVTQTTDENGNPITIITDEDGNETIIRQVEPGENDITFEDDELDLGEDAADETAASPAPDAGAKNSPGWILPAAIAGLVVVLIALVAVVRKKK